MDISGNLYYDHARTIIHRGTVNGITPIRLSYMIVQRKVHNFAWACMSVQNLHGRATANFELAASVYSTILRPITVGLELP